MNTPDGHKRLLSLATIWSVATAVVLIVVKTVAWLATGSVSLLASLLDSLMDAVASAVNLVAVRYSLQPADEEHRFGHGKAESLAGLAQAAFISGSALLLLFQAVDRLLHPRPLSTPMLGIWVMVFSIVATLVLLGVQRMAVRRTGSVAIRADALHYFTDLLTNASIILALILSMAGWVRADAIFGLGVGGYVLYSALKIGHEAVQHLMDRELPDEVKHEVVATALSHPDVHGVHEIRTRQAGQTRFIQLHLELDPRLSLARAHDIGDEVEMRIRKAVPGADVMIHQDPEDDSSPDAPGQRRTSVPEEDPG